MMGLCNGKMATIISWPWRSSARSDGRALAIPLRAEARDGDVKRVRVGAGVVLADVRVGEVLVAVADGPVLARFAEDVDTGSEIDAVHPLRPLRRQHPVSEIQRASVGAEEGLNTLRGEEIRLEAHGARPAAVDAFAKILGGWLGCGRFGAG